MSNIQTPKMTSQGKSRYRLKSSDVTRLWARVWRDTVANCYKKLHCKCNGSCKCKKVTDYRLSVEFCTDPNDRSSDKYLSRSKIFENISRNGMLPACTRHHKRDSDIVENIGKISGYEESEVLFKSLYWAFLLRPEMDADELSLFIAKCMVMIFPGNWDISEHFEILTLEDIKELGLEKADFPEEELNPLNTIYGHKGIELPDWTSLDLLALIGALFKDAYLAGALHEALKLKSIFLERLTYLSVELGLSEELSSEFYSLSSTIVLRSHLVKIQRTGKTHLENYMDISGGIVPTEVSSFLNAHYDRVSKDPSDLYWSTE